SEPARGTGPRHGAVSILGGEPLAAIRDRIAEVRAAAARVGRDPRELRVSVALRPIIAPTEAAAWPKAGEILERVHAKQGDRTLPLPEAVGARRLVDFAQQAEVHDKRLWTASGAGGCGARSA